MEIGRCEYILTPNMNHKKRGGGTMVKTEELVFGSKEWMEELNAKVNFPQMFTIYYGLHKETNKPILYVEILETKSTEPKNIKYGTIKPSLMMLLSPYRWLIEGVYYIESAEDYLKKLKELGKKWNVGFKN